MKSKEIKIAIIAIIAVVIVYLGIIFLKGLKLFSTDNIYYVEMANVGGLAKSAEVTASGMNIGQVKDITYNAASQMLTVAVELKEGMSLTKGSHANITKELLGAPKLNIVLGTNPSATLVKGDTIFGEAGSDLMAAAGNMIPQIEQMMPKLDSILTALSALTSDPALMQSLHNLEDITSNLKTTTTDINSMLSKDIPQLMTKANNICGNLETTTSKLNRIDIEGIANNANNTLNSANKTMNELQLFTGKLNNPNSSLGKLLNDGSVYNNLDATMENASKLLEDMREHPSRYVHFSVFGKKDKPQE